MVDSQSGFSKVATKWHDALSNALASRRGTRMSKPEIDKIIAGIPGIGKEASFVLPSDHCVNMTNEGACECAETERSILKHLSRGEYLVR
jgi:hypothetical protein